MHRMFVTEPTIFFQFEPRGRVLFILLGRIIAPLALITRERDSQTIFFLRHSSVVSPSRLAVSLLLLTANRYRLFVIQSPW